MRIIAIGNPGCGKSTTLNYLAGKLLFQSGVSIGEGLTYELNKEDAEVNIFGKDVTVTFCDTPGLTDPDLRTKAGEAISKVLKVWNFSSSIPKISFQIALLSVHLPIIP